MSNTVVQLKFNFSVHDISGGFFFTWVAHATVRELGRLRYTTTANRALCKKLMEKIQTMISIHRTCNQAPTHHTKDSPQLTCLNLHAIHILKQKSLFKKPIIQIKF